MNSFYKIMSKYLLSSIVIIYNCLCIIKSRVTNDSLGIYNGITVEENKWNFMVIIFAHIPTGFLLLCGGILLDSCHILTAAHCIDDVMKKYGVSKLVVYHTSYGLPDFEKDKGSKVESVTVHPNFVLKTFHSDIAVIRLKDSFNFYKHSLSCLPRFKPNDKILTDLCIVLGFGQSQNSKYSQKLQEAIVPVLDDTYCGEQTYDYDKNVMLCAGYVEGGRDACQGDSGGPLLCPVIDGDFYRFGVYGIVSYGDGCAKSNNPGYYTRVQPFLEWIDRVRKTP